MCVRDIECVRASVYKCTKERARESEREKNENRGGRRDFLGFKFTRKMNRKTLSSFRTISQKVVEK